MKELVDLTTRGVNNMLDKLKDWAAYVPPFVWYILVFILGYTTGSL